MRYPGYLLAACCLLLSLTTSVMAIENLPTISTML